MTRMPARWHACMAWRHVRARWIFEAYETEKRQILERRAAASPLSFVAQARTRRPLRPNSPTRLSHSALVAPSKATPPSPDATLSHAASTASGAPFTKRNRSSRRCTVAIIFVELSKAYLRTSGSSATMPAFEADGAARAKKRQLHGVAAVLGIHPPERCAIAEHSDLNEAAAADPDPWRAHMFAACERCVCAS